jgi:hypothetical protein
MLLLYGRRARAQAEERQCEGVFEKGRGERRGCLSLCVHAGPCLPASGVCLAHARSLLCLLPRCFCCCCCCCVQVAAVNQFKEIDTNGDGFIDRAELSAFLARQFRADAPADTVLQGLTDILHGYEEAMVAPPPPPPEAPRAADEEDDDVIPPPPGAR